MKVGGRDVFDNPVPPWQFSTSQLPLSAHNMPADGRLQGTTTLASAGAVSAVFGDLSVSAPVAYPGMVLSASFGGYACPPTCTSEVLSAPFNLAGP